MRSVIPADPPAARRRRRVRSPIPMMVFLAELALGLAYAWKKGALEWE